MKQPVSDLDTNAKQRIDYYAGQFTYDLTTEALRAASPYPIEAKHVDKAWQTLNKANRRWLKQLRESLIFLGGTLVSVLLQAALTQPVIPTRQAMFGLLGVILVAIAFQFDA